MDERKRGGTVSFRAPDELIEEIQYIAKDCGKKLSAYCCSVMRRHVRAQRLLRKHGANPQNTYQRILRSKMQICEDAGGQIDEPEVRSLLTRKHSEAFYRLQHGPGSLNGRGEE